MNMSYRKAIKFVALLVSALLIATVSAQTYLYMYIYGQGSITSGALYWEATSNTPGSAIVAGATATNMNFQVFENSPGNFTNCLHLVNSDASSQTFNISTTHTGDPSNFDAFEMVLYNSDGTRTIDKISIKDDESATGLSIAGSTALWVRFEIDPVIGKTSGTLTFTVELKYE